MQRQAMMWFFEGTPARAGSALLGMLAKLRIPGALLRPLVTAYIRWFGVDMSQVAVPSGGFCSFGDFFARRLTADARPICCGENSVASPCDGMIVATGRIEKEGIHSALVLKNEAYSIAELVADAAVAEALAGGEYCVIYLHPRDYHHVHAPADATVVATRHIPGARYSVAAWAALPGVWAVGKNERVAFELDVYGGRRCVLLMVAAFGVGGIVCEHLVSFGGHEPPVRTRTGTVELRRGDDIGAFRLGSTVVLLWPPGLIELDRSVVVGRRVLAGQKIGQVHGVGA